MDAFITKADRAILRDLAKKQMEYAQSEDNRKLITQWYQHNACQGSRPMVYLELWTFEQEIIPQRLRCQNEKARELEAALYRNFLNHSLFRDDFPVPDYFPVSKNVYMIPFGLTVQRHHADNSLGHQFVPYIRDLAEDCGKLGDSVIIDNRQETENEIALLDTLWGDILPVKAVTNCLYSSPTQDFIHLMSMETLYMAMLDYPKLFHNMMERYTADTLRFYRFLETEHLLETTNSIESLGQGTWCFNNELNPANPAAVKTTEVWGYMDSQETSAISPAMYKEFIFPYYQEIAKQYGLLSYGCCEPVHAIWDDCLSKLDNMRKASISPWCDVHFMGERLHHKKIIFHRKPSPNYLGIGANLEEQALREHIREAIIAARGCTLEITQRDVYTINQDEAKARRYIAILREEIENYWKP